MKNNSTYSAVYFKSNESPELFRTVGVFRRELFVDEYEWDLDVEDGAERDEFDRDDALHCALFHGNQIVGTFRAIRTDRPYLADEVFPHLAAMQDMPRQADVWEISRFGVVTRGHAVRYSLINYALMFHFAVGVGARALVAVTDLTHERLLSVLGVKSRRYGPPQLIGYDLSGRRLEAVVGEIPLHAQSGEKFQHLLSIINKVDIEDAAHVLGPTRISA